LVQASARTTWRIDEMAMMSRKPNPSRWIPSITLPTPACLTKYTNNSRPTMPKRTPNGASFLLRPFGCVVSVAKLNLFGSGNGITRSGDFYTGNSCNFRNKSDPRNTRNTPNYHETSIRVVRVFRGFRGSSYRDLSVNCELIHDVAVPLFAFLVLR
jgi:hypothetical protein